MDVLEHNGLDYSSNDFIGSQIVFEKIFKNNLLRLRGKRILGQTRAIERTQTKEERIAELAVEYKKLQKRYESGKLAIEPLPFDDFIKISNLPLFIANAKLNEEIKFDKKLARELVEKSDSDTIKRNFAYHDVSKINQLERIQINFRKNIFDYKTGTYESSYLLYNAIIVDIDDNTLTNNELTALARKFGANCIVHSKTKQSSKQVFFMFDFQQRIYEEKQIDKLKEVQDFLNKIFGGDPNFGGYIAKNPLCHEFDENGDILCEHYTEWLNNKFSSFRDLTKLISNEIEKSETEEQAKRTAKFQKREMRTGFSRNCDTFDFLRFFAYEYTDKNGSDSAKIGLEAYLREIIDSNPQITRGLPEFEIKKTIKSIVKFCVTTYKKNGAKKKNFTGVFATINKGKCMKTQQLQEIISNKLDVTVKLSIEEKTALANELCVSLKTIENNIGKIRKSLKERTVSNIEKIHIWRTVVQPALDFSVIAEKLNISEASARQMYSRFKRTFDESEQQKYINLYNEKPVIFK